MTSQRARGDADKSANQLVLNFLTVRRAVGLLGITLPLMLLAVAATPYVPFAPSISDFHHTAAREILTATVGAIAVFLFNYTGFAPDPARVAARPIEGILTDRRVAFVTGAGALGVALFPVGCLCAPDPEPLIWQMAGRGTSNAVHFLSVAAFIIGLTIFCLENFRRHDPADPDPDHRAQKDAERAIYKTCGQILILCLVILATLFYLKRSDPTGLGALITDYKLVFWGETIALFTFAIAWLIKGETLTALVTAMTRKSPLPSGDTNR